MKQIFIFGSSSAYGTGANSSGWADLLKQKLHNEMYSEGGIGEKYELFNFAKAGEPIQFTLETFKYQLEKYKRDGRIIIVVSLGGNNSKAENEPNNFVSTVEEYKKEMFELLTELKDNSNEVLFVGGGCVDESKTNPKPNPLTGGQSYFSNKRRLKFEEVLRNMCFDLGINFIQAQDGISNEEWIKKYLFKDGLHPNQLGHELIANKTWVQIKPLLLD